MNITLYILGFLFLLLLSISSRKKRETFRKSFKLNFKNIILTKQDSIDLSFHNNQIMNTNTYCCTVQTFQLNIFSPIFAKSITLYVRINTLAGSIYDFC